ncbi:DUF3649 domain-containing protein [Pseudomonas sp. RIT-PI-AD]|uniref:DUF3649 domain-containing protein n=1 Tax=Pseudomonas sp. RIT-PI-AD TaxID=3035294 RepID=UPI0021DB16C7|nr:DUF3649 domain-containing protein [Pseudomonas sp. RIT-PI-AD]
MKAAASLPLRYRLAVASRSLAAILGGYALATASSLCLALWLPLARSEAVLVGTMASFLVYCCAALWAFACRTALSAWIGIGVPAALLGALAWLAKQGASA